MYDSGWETVVTGTAVTRGHVRVLQMGVMYPALGVWLQPVETLMHFCSLAFCGVLQCRVHISLLST